MIWISSFPRSGNTFIRNVLHDVYGISSSTFHKEEYPMDENYDEYTFVKTHLLPDELDSEKQDISSVYLVRDGRDALISLAWHKTNIIEPGTDFKSNLREAILAAEGSYFGGWSENVEQWSKKASIIIFFEDLINNPIKQLERIRLIYPELPKPKIENLPTFDSQKFGNPKYGSGKKMAKGDSEREKEITKKWFRKGGINNWKDEFPENLYDLFWSYHRHTMLHFGFSYNGEKIEFNSDFDYDVFALSGSVLPEVKRKYRVLIESNKIMMHQNDGVKRYLSELLKALYPIALNPESRWQIDVYCNGKIESLKDFGSKLFAVSYNENRQEKISGFRKIIHYAKIIAKSIMNEETHDKLSILYRRIMLKIKLKYSKGSLGNTLIQAKHSEFDNYDLVHVPLPQHYEPFEKTNARLLVTVHDLSHKYYPNYHTKRNVDLAEKGMNFFLNKNSAIIAISKNTKSDLFKHYELNNIDIEVIYEAADTQKFKPLFNEHYAKLVKSYYKIPLNIPFIITVSTLEPRKNIINTIKAFEQLIEENPELHINLVICGGKGWKSKGIDKVKHKNRIIFTGFVDESHLPILYNEALVMCYVSYYEGFGLPLLEAISCGTPVIYGDNSSMKELFENYGLEADADNIEKIKEQMKKIVMDKSLNIEISKKSLKRSFDFSWRITAEQTIAVYENLITKQKDGFSNCPR